MSTPRGNAMHVDTDFIGRYWGLGFHQCRFGYESIGEVAEVAANYSAAGIPLETMWTGEPHTQLRAIESSPDTSRH